MTNLLIVLGYLLVGLGVGRALYLWAQSWDEDADIVSVMVTLAWPLALAVGALGALLVACRWLVARPPRRERIQAKIDRLERELDIR